MPPLASGATMSWSPNCESRCAGGASDTTALSHNLSGNVAVTMWSRVASSMPCAKYDRSARSWLFRHGPTCAGGDHCERTAPRLDDAQPPWHGEATIRRAPVSSWQIDARAGADQRRAPPWVTGELAREIGDPRRVVAAARGGHRAHPVL